MTDSLEDKNNSLQDELVFPVDAYSLKPIRNYFLLGLVISIFTFLIFGEYQNTDRLVKNYSILFINLFFVALFIYRKCIGIGIFDRHIRKKDIKVFSKLFPVLFVVLGHMLGFVVISIIFRG
ncbi:hypothetical protein [Sulfuriferula nivalis]|uniref:Uncharacterized protein n=1 Tax=Sulfuriferula nivalis TaxID=2675298 RepID=A0A809RI85_9PROT|nr:hypothetical protein [Sulfuriferula nivalis]BBP00554.1 hypothetical protein SFSGTM_12620 [Sulfuriferula nivalis]